LDKIADKADSALSKSEKNARRWYDNFVYGEDQKLRDLQMFTTAYAIGTLVGILTGQ